MLKWTVLILGILANASASVLIKLAVTPPRQVFLPSDPLATLANWPLLAGLALYGLAFLLYAVALQHLPLNVAHPILTSGAVAAVAVASALIFKESFSATTLLGFLAVIVGVALISVKVA